MIHCVDRGTERLILERLADYDPALAVEVGKEMFIFEDLASLDDRAIQLVLRQLPVTELAPALKGAPDAIRNRLLQNLSERAAAELGEELELLGGVRRRVVEDAQDRVTALVRQLEASGQIVITRGANEPLVA